jgi:hypothetical protein
MLPITIRIVTTVKAVAGNSAPSAVALTRLVGLPLARRTWRVDAVATAVPISVRHLPIVGAIKSAENTAGDTKRTAIKVLRRVKCVAAAEVAATDHHPQRADQVALSTMENAIPARLRVARANKLPVR